MGRANDWRVEGAGSGEQTLGVLVEVGEPFHHLGRASRHGSSGCADIHCPLESAVVERYTVQHFLDAYRAGFEAFDVEAIVDLFSYPCQITSDAGEVTVTRVATRAAWVPQIDRLVASYREIGVRTAEVLEFQVMDLTPVLAQVSVHWRLADGEGRSIYDFEASYTVAERGDGLRITAIAHNEMLRRRAAVERRRPS
jgi:hypothetical protein